MRSTDETRLPFFGAPPARRPRPARDEPSLRGKRVVLSTPTGFVYDMRAASDARPGRDGDIVVDIVTEEGYFAWMFVGDRPPSRTFPASLVWVE